MGGKEQCEDVHNDKNMKPAFGLKLLPRDPRNLQLGKIVSLPAYDLTPDEFCLETLEIKNQKDTDFCASFSSSTASELQESVLLAPEFTFAAAKEISGDIQGFGLSFYDVLKAHIQVGAIEKKNSPFSQKNLLGSIRATNYYKRYPFRFVVFPQRKTGGIVWRSMGLGC